MPFIEKVDFKSNLLYILQQIFFYIRIHRETEWARLKDSPAEM